MLVSLSKKFLFVSNLKSASSSIETALSEYSDICISRSEWGKHKGIASIERSLSCLIDDFSISDFFCFGVIRNPVQWLGSLYRSHKSTKFENTTLCTIGMSCSDFLNYWCEVNHDMARPQVDRFRDISGNMALNYLIDYDNVAKGFSVVTKCLGLENVELPWVNKSPDLAPIFDFEPSTEELALIRERYWEDFQACDNLTMRNLRNSWRGEDAFFKFDEFAERVQSEICIFGPAKEQPPLTEDDVVWAYRFILGRDPESSEVVKTHLGCGSRENLRCALIRSDEFKLNYNILAA